MYKGKKEPKSRLVVDQALCRKFDDKNNKRWIEIFVPPENIADYFNKNNYINRGEWGSFMVDPDQVNFIPNTEKNLIMLTHNTTITVSVKNKLHKAVKTDYMSPACITGRWLKYYYHRAHANEAAVNTDLPSEEIYKAWVKSGMRINVFIHNLPSTYI